MYFGFLSFRFLFNYLQTITHWFNMYFLIKLWGTLASIILFAVHLRALRLSHAYKSICNFKKAPVGSVTNVTKLKQNYANGLVKIMVPNAHFWSHN